MSLSFDDYAKKIEALGENMPAIFKQVAGRSAVHAQNLAVELTDREKLVDTGAYRRNWNAETVKDNKDYGVALQNNMEYASYLEEGHALRNGKRWNGRFVGKRALGETEAFALIELQYEFDVAMTAKKYNISKGEARKYYK